MRYGEALLEEIARRTDLVQLVGRRVKLQRRGRVFLGLCPFHKEKTPSFKVENERRTYHCFGCAKGGDCFKWLQETEGLTFPEAVQKLANEAGVALPAFSPEDEARETRRKSLYDIIQLAEAFFEDQLRGRAGTQARAYLKSRGLNGDIAKRFHIGYAPDSHSALKDHLAANGISLGDMVEAGLVRAGDAGKPPRDFFFDRVMFPIADMRGRTIAFGGRALTPDAKPKYINTGETGLFSKGHLLYNFRNAREAVAKGALLIVAEGYMDVIALSEAGFGGAVAPLGTALTEDQLQLLWKVSPEPVLCLDGDEAGTRAAQRAARLALPHLMPGQSLTFVFLPKGEDPDSFLRTQGAEPMRTLLAKAQPLTEMLWKSETEGRDFATPERRAGLEAELARLTAAIRDTKIADYYRRDFDERVFKAFKQRKTTGRMAGNARSGAAWRGPSRKGSWGGAAAKNPETVSSAVKNTFHVLNLLGGAREIQERHLMALLLLAPELVERYSEALAWCQVENPQLDRLKHELLNLAASGIGLERTSVENHLVRQGMGALAERLKAQKVVQSDLKGQVDEAARNAIGERVLAQLRTIDLADRTGLKTERDEALKRYLEGGANEDWDELQRLNGLIRKAGMPQ